MIKNMGRSKTNNMNWKKLFILSFVFLFSFSLVSAANTITLDTPAQDASISGSTYTLNATLDSNTQTITNVTFFYDDGSSNTTIGTNNTASGTATEFTFTWDTTAINDVNNLIVWANASNSSGSYTNLDSSTGVDIDNGNPTATLSSSTFATEAEVNTEETFNVGLDADASIGISSCLVYYTNDITNEISTQSVSASANACSTSTTPSDQSLAEGDSFTVVMEATDGNSDKTNSSSRILRISSSGGGGNPGVSVQQTIKGAAGETTNILSNIFNKIINFFKNIFS